jgi:hypothetical protein
LISNQANPLIRQAYFVKKCLVLGIIVLLLLMTLLLLELFISGLPLVGLMAHDAPSNGPNHGMMASIMACDSASCATT